MPKSNFTNEYTVFREMLKSLRADSGITQSALSASLGMAQSFVSKYEMGERRLDLSMVRRLMFCGLRARLVLIRSKR